MLISTYQTLHASTILSKLNLQSGLCLSVTKPLLFLKYDLNSFTQLRRNLCLVNAAGSLEKSCHRTRIPTPRRCVCVFTRDCRPYRSSTCTGRWVICIHTVSMFFGSGLFLVRVFDVRVLFALVLRVIRVCLYVALHTLTVGRQITKNRLNRVCLCTGYRVALRDTH